MALLILFTMVYSVPAEAGTRAARLIGAYSDDWPLANSTIGPLQTNKFFYRYLPPSYRHTTSNGQPGCGAKNGAGKWIYPPSRVTCIIVYNHPNYHLQKFIQSIPSGRQVIISYCNEPEGTNNRPRHCGYGSAQFKATFKEQSALIHQYDHGARNIRIAQISETWEYVPGSSHDNGGRAPDCHYIVPAGEDPYLNLYLADIYEPHLKQDRSLGGDVQWTTWAKCTRGRGLVRGIAEYAVMCRVANETENGGKSIVAATLADDDAYLKANFPRLAVWEYWYTRQSGNGDGCAFTNPQAIKEWKAIEAGN